MRMFGRAGSPAALTGLLVSIALLMTSCASSHADADGGSTPWVGYTWRIVEVGHEVSSTSIPAALNGYVAFAPDGTLSANDGINGYFGRYVVDGDGYRPNNAGATLAGYAAVRALTGSDPVAATSDGSDNLQLAAGGYTITCTKQGLAHNDEQPASPTSTRS
jgi:hypothetical protein